MKVILYYVEKEMTLKAFLYEKGISKSSLSAIKENGALFVNEESVTVRRMLYPGDQIKVHLPIEQPSHNLLPFQMKLQILFEDEWFIIISKPANVSTSPSRDHRHGSLVEGVLYYMQQNNEQTIPHIVTRLDRGTSGIVIFAKHQLLHHMISKSDISKYYLAIVHGIVDEANGDIRLPIGRAPHSIIEREVSENGKFAHTSYNRINDDGQHSLLKLQLYTGRTHQIRVHLSHIGYPIVGDSLYGSQDEDVNHQLLHCYNVMFIHPITHEKINIIDEMPENFVLRGVL